jgi:hypothetical protein
MDRSAYLVDQKEEMREEKAVRAKILVAAETCLQGRKSLLIMLQGVDVLAAILMGQAESGDGHHSME